jgi:hypothetical protein
MAMIVDKIVIEDNKLMAYYSHTEDDTVLSDVAEWNYDENSAVALCVDLLSRLIITEEVGANGVSLGPANGQEI